MDDENVNDKLTSQYLFRQNRTNLKPYLDKLDIAKRDWEVEGDKDCDKTLIHLHKENADRVRTNQGYYVALWSLQLSSEISVAEHVSSFWMFENFSDTIDA